MPSIGDGHYPDSIIGVISHDRLLPEGFTVLASEKEINEINKRLASQIALDYCKSENLVILGVLNACSYFASDLTRMIARLRGRSSVIDFIKVDTHGINQTKSSGKAETKYDSKVEINGDVLIIDTIYDSGLTVKAVIETLREKTAKSIKVCTLFKKENADRYYINVDYLGINIPDRFVIGYGLDGKNGDYRDLPFTAIKIQTIN